jgi:hypothetical protein
VKRWISLLATGLLIGGLTAANLAVEAKDRAAAEHKLKQERLSERGVRSGQLTPREANRLHRQQERRRAEEGSLKTDGRIRRPERVRL